MPRADGSSVLEPQADVARRGFQPTPQQLRYLAAASDARNTGFEQIATAARVNRVTAWRWRQDTEFIEWFTHQVLRAFGMKYAVALDRAADLAIQGSPEHLKLLMSKMGDLHHGNDDGSGNATQQVSVHINVPRPEPQRHEPQLAGSTLPTIDVTARPMLPPTSDKEH